jgi:ribonuclease HII
MEFPTYNYEKQKQLEGFMYVAGCDEVGIGPLAGPVVAACVVLDPKSIGEERSKDKWWYRVRDSKTTTEKERDELILFIQDHSLDFAVGVVERETIDRINIYHAGKLAMKKSVDSLKTKPSFLFVDGNHTLKNLEVEQEAVVGGDAKILSIASASIVAKVARDKILRMLHETYPEYGFDKHKGYGTKFHRDALVKYGITPAHRKSFAFVQQCIEKI